ncbi:hypothetical protein N665_3157s0001 [Sinapis alba]|nr:hypothetical protein N665_3157s0001 [Sinapis alba]
MTSPIRRCSQKGKAVATDSESESTGSPLIRRPRAITLGGMDNPRPTSAYLASLDIAERDIVRFSLSLEDREATGHAPADDVEQFTEIQAEGSIDGGLDSVVKEKISTEKEVDFALADFLPMKWNGNDFEFDEEIGPDQERTLSTKKGQNWANHLPTKSSFKSVRRLIFQTNPPAGFSFLIPADHQRPWTPPSGYACVYESWFVNSSLWSPLPEFLTTYCNRRKIALGQYTANGIRILVTLTVLAAELGIKMSARLFEELTTPSITAKTGFFYGKMVPKYNVITGKPSKVNFWNHRYFYVKINEASFEDPTIILNGYFNSNIGTTLNWPTALLLIYFIFFFFLAYRISKWSQGGLESFLEEVKAIRTLSHQHWPDISEACIQAALKRINRAEIPSEAPTHFRKRSMGKLNLSALPSYADTIGTPEHGRGSGDTGRPNKQRRDSSSSRAEPSSVTPLRSPLPPPEVPEESRDDDQGEQNPSAEMLAAPADMAITDMPMAAQSSQPPPEDAAQGSQLEERVQITRGEEVEYPHVLDFKYRSLDVPFIEDNKAPARLFRQIKLKRRGMPELDQLHQGSRYREMTRAGAMFFGNANLMVRDYEAKLKAQEASLMAKTGSLKKKRKEIAELSYKCNSYESQIEALTAEKKEASSEAELARSRNELLSAEIEALKAQKDLLDSRCLSLEQEKSELSADFEATTKRLRESREHEVKKERLRVESVLRQRVIPTYEKMGQFLGEKPEIQSRLALYSQAKGTREGLEKIQSQGLAMDEVLQKAKVDEAHFLEELQRMEVVDADEIDLRPISLDEHGSNMMVFSPQDLEELRS